MRMKNILGGLLVLLGLQCGALGVHGQTPEPSAAASATAQAEQANPGGKRAREFQGDDLGQVLRLLARQAKINLMIDDAIKGNVNVRLENTSAMEAIEAIVHLYKLTMSKDEKGIYYLTPPAMSDAVLDFLAKPETAERIAAYKHNLYTALIKEGFSAEEALEVMNEGDLDAAVAAFGRKIDASPQK